MNRVLLVGQMRRERSGGAQIDDRWGIVFEPVERRVIRGADAERRGRHTPASSNPAVIECHSIALKFGCKTRKQPLVPGASPDLDVAGAALRTERPEPRQLVAALRGRRHGEAAERAHQVKRLALAGLPRILAKPDADPCAILRRGIEQQLLDIARVRPLAYHPQAARSVATAACKLRWRSRSARSLLPLRR
jgi:hypothetical protein